MILIKIVFCISSSPLAFWRYKLTNKNYIYLQCITCFDICIHYEMITTVKLISISITSYKYFSILLWWKHLRHTLSRFQVYGIVVLTVVVILGFRSPELIDLAWLKLGTQISPHYLPPNPGSHHSPLLLWVWLF